MITNELYDNPYNHEIRNYEVSLWTLQDEFITVLKWSDVEHKGTILDPKLIIADDGTENFTFTIPMYIYERGLLKENPIWYNTRNGNLMVNLRKIKVIFNKMQLTERVFELLITKIIEEHEQDHLFCNVECEGLAFHELGKIGYTEVLSAADFEFDYKNWLEKGYWTKRDGTIVYSLPILNVLYWCNARLGLELSPLNADASIDPRQWYYDINMQWSSFEKGGVIELNNNNQIAMRDTRKVYEESFVTYWEYDLNTNKLLPGGIEEYREKERVIEATESNLYNITQTIAENFGIFCKYIYSHDVNYHISGRKILFFNNYLHDENIMSLTYPYSSLKVTREMDATDVVTKLYVKSVENSSTLLGEDSIRYCDANQMLEDYIFNFDYLRETNSITEELYKAIDLYIKDIHYYNSQIIPLLNKITVYQNQELELESKITTYTNSAALALELIDNNEAYILSLLADYGVIGEDGVVRYMDAYNANHPDSGIMIQDDNGLYYINLNTRKKGIKTDSVKIFRKQNPLSLEVTNFSFKFDEYGNPTRIYGVAPIDDRSLVFLTYLYEPRLYYDAIIAYFQEKLAHDTANKEKAEEELLQLNNDPDSPNYQSNNEIGLRIQAERDLKQLLLEKEAIIKEFNYMMGPALREGNWTPENYLDYGERYNDNKTFPIVFNENLISVNTGRDFSLIWDNKLFDSEQDIYYELGINLEKKAYPCINLSNIPANHAFWSHMEDYSFIFNSNYYDAGATIDIRNIKSFKIGSEAVLGFVTSNGASINNYQVYPVLILVGAKTMTDEPTNFEDKTRMVGGTIGFMMDPNRGAPRLGVIKSTISGKNVITEMDSNYPIISIGTNDWKFGSSHASIDNYQAVYPRIKFSSLLLKYQDDKFFIHKDGILLTNYEDYSILNRNLDSGTYAPEFYVTIKPLALLKNTGPALNRTISVGYTLSNAGTAIYLDAIEIAKENAYPKVAYTVDPNILNKDIISTLYDKLNWLVMINDSLLKLVNTFGYISKLELNLDFPDKDSIEIKNYKSKFEDLFSTIVASTESIKSNANTMAALSAGTYNVSAESLANTLNSNSAIVNEYLDNYFLTSEVVQKELGDLFLGASEVLADSTLTLDLLLTLNEQNNTILGAFALRIKQGYSPTIYRLSTTPTTFKRDDIWIEIDSNGNEINTYTALCDSTIASEGYGWNKTHNGSMALIVGQLNIDAESGKVELLGEDMYITGSHSINITGPYINIESFTYENGANAIGAGIFMTAKLVRMNETELTAATILSKVSIEPDEISMFGSKITMLTTRIDNNISSTVTAMLLDGENGIWLGSNAGIKLYSGVSNTVGATSIELMPTHLLMGVGNAAGSTAIKITSDAFVVASGSADADTLSSSNALTGIKSSLTGVKIADGFFGVVTKDSSNNVNAIIMNNNGLTLAYNLVGIADAGGSNIANKTSGSYVRLSGSGITISSGAKLNISASDLMIGTLNLNEYGNATFKMDDNEIWLGVKRANNKGYLSISNTEIKLGTGNTYVDLQEGWIDLHAGANSYMTMGSTGIVMVGQDIKINGNPVWSLNNIFCLSTKPTDWKGYSKIIWFQPVTRGSMTYTSKAGDTEYKYSSSSAGGSRSVTTASDTNMAIPQGSSYYRYTLIITIRAAAEATGDNQYTFTPTITGTGSLTFSSQTRSIRADRTDTLTFYLDGGSTNVGANQLNINVTVNDGSGFNHTVFRLYSATLAVEIDSGSGQFPCNVYYLEA